MPGWPDEEPDVDEVCRLRDPYDWREVEEKWAPEHCARCGVKGHKAKKCPTVTPDLLRRTN